jgi:hypothetical protein
MLTLIGGEGMKQNEKNNDSKKKSNNFDEEFSSELTGEEHAVKTVQNALFEMYSQAGNSSEDKE